VVVGVTVSVAVGVAVGVIVDVTVGRVVAVGVAVGVAVVVAVGVDVSVGVAVGVAVGISVGVAVGQGLAMMVTLRVKGTCTPSSITTSLMMGMSCGMVGRGPLQPKLMVCVSPLASEPAQVMLFVSGLYTAPPLTVPGKYVKREGTTSVIQTLVATAGPLLCSSMV
jgi:hypothetical protein